MNKEEKLEAIAKMVKEFGVSPEEVFTYLQKKDQLSLETLEKIVVSLHYVAPEEVAPGMYVYANGQISAEIIAGQQIKAVVGYVEGSEVLAVCLRERRAFWSATRVSVPETKIMTSGKEATRKILEVASRENSFAAAAQYCYKYAEDGVKQGEAFLPSITELERLFTNKDKIDASLSKSHAYGFGLKSYWSSTEDSSRCALNLGFDDGTRRFNDKSFYYYVRPVISFKI